MTRSLCEFKYTQSVNEKTLLQARLYDYLYLSSRRLKRRAVQTFVVSSRTPQPATLGKAPAPRQKAKKRPATSD